MQPASRDDVNPDGMSPDGISDESPPEKHILAYASDWFGSLRSRVHITTELALAEAKLAAVSLSVMVFFAVLAAILLLSAWGLLVAGLVHGLQQTGLPLWALLTGVAVIHIAAALLLALRAIRLSDNMSFAKTRDHISSAGQVSS